MIINAQPADLTARYDSRLIKQLSIDDNSTNSGSSIAVLLSDAEAEIMTAVLQGSIYTPAELQALVSSGDTQLLRLNCDVALRMMAERRVGGIPSALADIVKRATDLLDAIRQGKRVLNVVTNRAADTPALLVTTGLQRQNLGDVTANDFWSNDRGTNTVNAPGT